MNDLQNATYRIIQAEAQMHYYLTCFGDHLAEREGYRVHKGMDAVHFFLIQKYGWPPAAVRKMHPEDLRFLMEEEMHGWTVPKEAQPSP